jgi:3-hydroxyisobutyrate dehydrogenase-like beta-hydroxyacid dehydrogenase
VRCDMSRRTRKNIGLIGLGIIGSRVRETLRQKGFHVFVWNRTPRPVPNFVGAPAELAEMCDFIQVFVSDDDALLYIVKQLSPGLSARHVVIAHSTVAPHSMCAAAEIVERRGARFIEAPFTGSKEAAEKGELVYYVGGEATVIEEARPLLAASSKEVLAIGEVGQATAIKVATNMITAASVQAAAEAMALVQAAGLPLEKFTSALQQNASFSKTLAMKVPKMIEGNFDRHFSVQHMLKDMQIASRLGLSHHIELAVTAAARDRLLEQMQRGHGDDDYSAVARKYFQDASGKSASESDLDLFQAASAESSAKPAESTESGEPAQPEAVETTLAAASADPEKLPASALEALQAHMPAAPFLNPVMSGESVAAERVEPEHERPAGGETPPTAFLSEPVEQMPPDESEEARGFFSRLLRRANS